MGKTKKRLDYGNSFSYIVKFFLDYYTSEFMITASWRV